MSGPLPRWLALTVVLAGACAPPDAPPTTDAASVALGAPDSLLFWRGAQQLAGYRSMERVFPSRVIDAGGDPLPLPERPTDLADFTFEVGGESYDVDGFMEANHVVGLLVLHDGAIAVERYARGNDRETRWLSYSISKSLVSLLVGAAVRDGYIRSVDEPLVRYLPALEGTAYEPVTFRHALSMASGVTWSDDYEDYDGDINRSLRMGTLELLDDLGRRDRVAEPGTRWNYNTGETHLLATALRAAIGNNLSTYASAEIWRPFGMEADATWMLVEPDGGEHGGCCFSATLRDYGRLGLFALGGGVLPSGERVLPDGWMAASTAPTPANPGYGWLWWLQDGGAYAAIGIFGQMIWVDPAADLVVVTHSAWPAAVPYFGRGYAFARALRDVFGPPSSDAASAAGPRETDPATRPEALGGVACADEAWAAVLAWGARGTGRPEPGGLAGRTATDAWRFPTAEVGVWVRVATRAGAPPRLARVAAEAVEERSFDDACRPVRESRRIEPGEGQATRRTANVFTDDDLRGALRGGDGASSVVVYLWSPHMPLSVDGWPEIVQASARVGARVVPVLFPDGDRGFAEREAARVGMPVTGLREASSVDLTFRDALVHAPAILVYTADGVSPVLPGYRDAGGYERYLRDFLETVGS